MTPRDALLALAELLAPGEGEVAGRVALAHDDPAGYLAEHADQLDERGIDAVVPELAWIALVDALADSGRVAEVDWKEDGDEVVCQLRELRSSPSDAWEWYVEDGEGMPTYDFLHEAGTRLRESGTVLAVLDIESDCYPLVLVGEEQAGDLVSLAETAGFAASPFGTE